MNRLKLLNFIQSNREIGEVIGSSKQNCHSTVTFTNENKVKLLLPALKRRKKALDKLYVELIAEGEEVLRNAKTKAKPK